MNKIYQKSFSGEKNAGFTLIELLVVVLIIGILSSVALPQYQRAVRRSRFTEILSVSHAVAQDQRLFKLANGAYAADFEELGMEMPSGWQIYGGSNRVLVNNKKMMSLDISAGGLSTVYWNWDSSSDGNDMAYQQYWDTNRKNCIAYTSGGAAAKALCASLGGVTTSSSYPYIYVL